MPLTIVKVYYGHVVAFVKRKTFTISGPVFNICTRFTPFALLGLSVILTCQELLADAKGRPIKCKLDEAYKDKDMIKAVETYCWISSTFLVPDAFENPMRASRAAHPGLTNHQGINGQTFIKQYAYYQWVSFAVFFQGWLCYFPWYIWEHLEQGLIQNIVCGLHLGGKLEKEEEAEKNKQKLINYLIGHLNLHKSYAMSYWFCEVLCFLGIVAQMILLDWFFDGEFKKYGFNVLGLLELTDGEPISRYDPFIYVFPRVTKCVFHKFGQTNTIEKIDAICLLVLNQMNEKIYIFLWFWLCILLVLTGALVLYRGLIILFPAFRCWLLHSRNRMVSSEAASFISRKSASDWWIFYMLGQNLEPRRFSQVAEEFAKQTKAIELATQETKNV